MKRFLLTLMLAAGPALAAAATNQAAPTELDPLSNKRAVELSQQLRCLVCQNQTIADSHAELAVDLKNQINEQIRAGRSDKEIIDFMVQRYGDFVLYKPPFKAETVLLWVGPVLLLVLGLGGYFFQLQRRRARIDERPLTEAERREADRLLGLGQSEDSSK
jgi:cytochrome c-type biogenesis protein CcmH